MRSLKNSGFSYWYVLSLMLVLLSIGIAIVQAIIFAVRYPIAALLIGGFIMLIALGIWTTDQDAPTLLGRLLGKD